MVALSFTTILIQVQTAYQGHARDLLPILVAALLVMAGAARSLEPGPLRKNCIEVPAFIAIANEQRAPPCKHA